MKSFAIVFVLGLLAGSYGAATNWDVSGGCMAPAPLTGIVTGIIYGGGVWIVGSFFVGLNIGVKAITNAYFQEQVIAEPMSAAQVLLRPSSAEEANSDALLRPATYHSGCVSKELLRACEKPEDRLSK